MRPSWSMRSIAFWRGPDISFRGDSTAAVSRVREGRADEGNVVVSPFFDEAANGNFVQEGRGGAAGAEIIANGKEEFVLPGRGIDEERGIAAPVGIRASFVEQHAGSEESDPDIGGGFPRG